MLKNCTNCKHCGYDSNLLGYCDNKLCVAYRKIVIDDNGCKYNSCDYFEFQNIASNKIVFRFWRKADGAVFDLVVADRKAALCLIQNTPIKKSYTNVTVTLNKYNKEKDEETFNLYSERSAQYFGMNNLKKG